MIMAVAERSRKALPSWLVSRETSHLRQQKHSQGFSSPHRNLPEVKCSHRLS
jgi:hypothetical protein